MTHHESLVGLLARYSYQEGDVVLSSGAHSQVYLDAKLVTYHPDGARLVGEEVLRVAQEYGANAVGGLTLGADAIVLSTVFVSAEQGTPMPGFVVRKEPKEHGLKKWIEGVAPETGAPVAIVDDVITSGKSVIDAVRRAREAGAEVVVVIGLVDREQGGAGNIARETGVPFRALCTMSEVRERHNAENGATA